MESIEGIEYKEHIESIERIECTSGTEGVRLACNWDNMFLPCKKGKCAKRNVSMSRASIPT
jgi:hypothetical protein